MKTSEPQATYDLGTQYAEKVYAGVLGKIIGVYLGRPFEGMAHDDVLKRLGEVNYYVHEEMGHQLVVTDDDISGTFTFIRALEDHGFDPSLTAEQIGQTWLNYLVEKRTILWWGGMGTSTEHTAYLRLKNGVPAPKSGSIEANGKVVAEQIGSQIFIDGWGLICPGDPERAVHYARLASSVSHDGEAIYGAQVVAAMVAQAFVEQDIDKLLDTAVSFIPADSLIAQMIADIRGWYAEGLDWRAGFRKIEAKWGYDKFGGGCHMIPNHGLIIHALLHGGGDFQKSLMVVNTCGWDTDCNSANVGCIMGVRNGLAGIDGGPDWRGPVADRLYLPTADGGSAVTDAVRETYRLVNYARKMRGEDAVIPKDGARFHFSLPGSVQGFESDVTAEARGVTHVFNLDGRLAIDIERLAPGRVARVRTDTFPRASLRKASGYAVVASPTLYTGQTVCALVTADEHNLLPINAQLYISHETSTEGTESLFGPITNLAPGETVTLEFVVPETGGQPICEVGIQMTSPTAMDGLVFVDWLRWDGTPNVKFTRCDGHSWRHAWMDGMDDFPGWGTPYRLIQNEGTGVIIQGTRDWTDYRVSSTITLSLVEAAGIGARMQGMKRYYALELVRGGEVRLVRELNGQTVLASKQIGWQFEESHELAIEVEGDKIRGFVDGALTLEATDSALTCGGIGFVVSEGRIGADVIQVSPL